MSNFMEDYIKIRKNYFEEKKNELKELLDSGRISLQQFYTMRNYFAIDYMKAVNYAMRYNHF